MRKKAQERHGVQRIISIVQNTVKETFTSPVINTVSTLHYEESSWKLLLQSFLVHFQKLPCIRLQVLSQKSPSLLALKTHTDTLKLTNQLLFQQ